MKNKKAYVILIALILIGSLFLTYNIYQNRNKVIKTKKRKQNNLAIMIKEDGATDYTKSNSKDIPKGDYVLNRDKSYCKNNGKIGDYDSTLGKVSFSFIGTDSCFLYFDYKEDTSLYGTIKKRAKTDTTYLALYTGEGADTYAKPVYYYKGNVQNNNVLFGGFCWKIVRTTETGGVKIVYNGIPFDVVNTSPIEQSSYANISNDATYPYTFDSTSKTWVSTNKTDGKTGTITFTVATAGDYYLSYVMSSEAGYDKAKFYKNGNPLGNSDGYGGTVSGAIALTGLTTSDEIKVEYTKDSSGASGSDTVTFSIGKAVGDPVKSCNNTGTDSQIGKSAFNSSYAHNVGYMYNPDGMWHYSSKYIISSTSFSGTKAYGDGATYASNRYTLTNATTLDVSSSNISTLVGKYTCNSSSTTETCSSLWYIVGYSGTTIYFYSLSGGTTDGTTLANKDYVFGSSFTYANETYTLSDTVTLNSDTFIADSSNVNTHHYTCLSSGATCSSIYYIYGIIDGNLRYIILEEGKSVNDALNEMLYADDVNKEDSTIKVYIDNWAFGYNYYEYSKEVKFLTKEDRTKIVKFKNCVGRRSENDTSKDGSVECSSTYDSEIGLLPVYDFLNASIDPNCITTVSPSCQNYNYLSDGDSTWLANGSGSETNEVYSMYLGYIANTEASETNNIRPIIHLSEKAMLEKGKGTKNNPYVIR